MLPRVTVIGVYAVPSAPEPCHLVEVEVRESPGFDPSEFTQPDPSQPASNWQVAYDERVLSIDGVPVTDPFDLPARTRAELFRGSVRLTFFLHYLDAARPLATPFGLVDLPAVTARPERLSGIRYEAP